MITKMNKQSCLDDVFLTSGDFRHKSFLCSAYKKIFAHIEKHIRKDLSLQKSRNGVKSAK